MGNAKTLKMIREAKARLEKLKRFEIDEVAEEAIAEADALFGRQDDVEPSFANWQTQEEDAGYLAKIGVEMI